MIMTTLSTDKKKSNAKHNLDWSILKNNLFIKLWKHTNDLTLQLHVWFFFPDAVHFEASSQEHVKPFHHTPPLRLVLHVHDF